MIRVMEADVTRFLSLAAAALLVAGCTGYSQFGTENVGPGYAVGGGDWSSGGGITTVARVFERDGRTAVCGAWTADRQSALTLEFNNGVIEAASISIDGRRLVQNLSFMPRVRYAEDITGAQANCVVTSVPWQAEYATMAPRMNFPRIVHVLETDDMGERVIFRETSRPDIVA